MHQNHFFVQKLVSIFSPLPPKLLEVRFQKIIFFTSEKNIRCSFFLHPVPNLIGIKIQTQKSPHSFDIFETLKSFFCSKYWCPFFLHPLTYLRFDSKRLFLSLLKKTFGINCFFTSHNLLGNKIQKKKIASQLWQFWNIKIALLFKKLVITKNDRMWVRIHMHLANRNFSFFLCL